MMKYVYPALIFLFCALAFAEDLQVDAHNYKSSPFSGNGTTSLSGKTSENPYLQLGFQLDYSRNPLSFTIGDKTSNTLKNQVIGDLMAAASFFSWFDAGISIPLALYQEGDGVAGFQKPESGRLGDIRLLSRFFMPGTAKDLVISLIPELSLPTATSPYTGRTMASFKPTATISYSINNMLFGGDIGYRIVKNEKIGAIRRIDTLEYAVNAAYKLEAMPLQVTAELYGSFFASYPFEKSKESPLEALFSGTYEIGNGIKTNAGFGIGATNGFATPDYRVFAGALWSMPLKKKASAPVIKKPADHDNDGISDNADKCPEQPETKNNLEDDDGCPDILDKDNDGIADEKDKCPDQPETKNNFKDDDGCPDIPDRDSDGISNEKDMCPEDPETQNQFLDDDGCPDTEPVILDAPKEPEPTVEIKKDKIEISDKIYFELGKAEIAAKSYLLLNKIADLLKNNPKIKIVIEGHTDNTGGKEINIRISEQRAESVKKYLVGQGAESSRIKTKGHGPNKPLMDNNSPEGREQNRRVEFNISE